MSMTITPLFWHIPYRRNPFFTGREDVLKRLHQALHAEHRVALSQPQGVTGLGGIGKTQAVLEYAYRYQNEYNAVFWVRADSLTALNSSMVEVAQALELPERNERDQEIIVQAVLRWFRSHTDWLLIYDNVDDLSIAEPFLPKAGMGHLLFTSRSQALGGLAHRLDVVPMDPEIGALLLLRRASLLALQATLDLAQPDEQRLGQVISQELAGLPLALDQAGAYIKETPCSLANYLALYQDRRRDILKVRGKSEGYPASVATTWSLSLEKVRQAHPAASELLNFCAFLAPDVIPEDLLTKGAPHLGQILAPVVAQPLQLDQICKEILRFSLLQRRMDENTLTMHRLVQTVLRDTLTLETQRQWMERAIFTVNDAFPVPEFANWATCEQLLPHALTCAIWIDEGDINVTSASFLLNQTGHYLHDRGRYTAVEPLLIRALDIREQLGPEYPNVAVSLNNLALLYKDQGKYEQAEPLYARALAICEQQAEPDHLDSALNFNNLAGLYHEQGKYEQAEPLLIHSLAIHEQQLGADHPDIATSLNNLAMLYRSQGKYAQAEPLCIRSLAIYERQWGKEHPNTATSLGNLAGLYQDQGKYTQAEPLYIRALAIREQQLGADHPATANSLNNLAALYQNQGKYEQAEPLYVRALAISEQELGADHPTVATKLNNLAALYQNQGKYTQAEPLYDRALAICEQQLGADHPDTATSLNNLANLYYDQEKYTQAEPLCVRALAICEQQLGADHPDTATSLDNLAGLYREQGKYAQARPLYVRSLAIRKQRWGTEHPATAASLNNLALLYRDQGKYAQARPLFIRALAICEQQLGADHPDTATCLDNLASLYRGRGKYAQAEPLYVRALDIRERQLGADHPDTVTSLRDLALLYYNQEKYTQAEPLLIRTLAIYKQQLGPNHPTTRLIYRILLTSSQGSPKGRKKKPGLFPLAIFRKKKSR